MPKPAKKGKASRPSHEGRSFNEDTLAQLTSRIDQSLSGKDQKRKQPPTNASDKQQPKRQRGPENGQPKSGPKDRKDDQAALLAEIKALGGDEKDLELINEVNSDDEDYVKDSKRPVDKRLKEELAALSKELGFAEIAPEAASDVDEGEEEEDEDDGGEDDEEEEQDDAESDTPQQNGNRKPGGMVSANSSLPVSLTADSRPDIRAAGRLALCWAAEPARTNF